MSPGAGEGSVDGDETAVAVAHTTDINRGELVVDPDAVWSRIQTSQLFMEYPRTTKRKRNCTRIVLMSDTHGLHNLIRLPSADVLIHAGDFTKKGERSTLASLSDYFGRMKDIVISESILCIAGNHDVLLDREFYNHHWHRFHSERQDTEEVKLDHCVYLQDSSFTISNGDLKVYGSPWTPEFFNWAFNAKLGYDLDRIWQQIPTSTDILVTHGPPLGRGDMTLDNRRAGCPHLLQHVQERVRPRLHVFGHIHEGAGISYDGHTLFCNASNVDVNCQFTNPCIVVDIPHDKASPVRVVDPVCTLQGIQLQEWFQTNRFVKLAEYCSHVSDLTSLPSGADLLNTDSAYEDLVDILGLHQDDTALQDLRRALSHIYVESFVS